MTDGPIKYTNAEENPRDIKQQRVTELARKAINAYSQFVETVQPNPGVAQAAAGGNEKILNAAQAVSRIHEVLLSPLGPEEPLVDLAPEQITGELGLISQIAVVGHVLEMKENNPDIILVNVDNGIRVDRASQLEGIPQTMGDVYPLRSSYMRLMCTDPQIYFGNLPGTVVAQAVAEIFIPYFQQVAALS